MGKRQHQKDKLYLTCTEWTMIYGGHRSNDEVAQFKRIPFDHCSLSFQPFVHPYCTTDGVIFDLSNIVPFLRKHGIDPASGNKMDMKSLIKLNFYRNNDGQYHCPILYKVFTEHSHIVAIKTTGNVFSYESVEQLNLKPKHFKDLLNDEPFVKSDIITLLEPNNIEKFNVTDYYHVKHQLQWNDEDDDEQSDDSNSKYLRNINNETRDTLQELSLMKETPETTLKSLKPNVSSQKSDKINAAHYSTGTVAAGFTSTVMDPITKFEAAVLDDDTVRYARVKKKGYVRIETNLGPINLELFCDQTQKTCDNFIRHCNSGYYIGTVFHRLIKHFMVQGGDPTGTGTGGESAFGMPFGDEIKQHLSHSGRGILSMANSGPNTNKSQFFLTFRSCKHLDKKHTIFGRIVGGMETLDKIERITVDSKEKPLDEIKILKTIVFVDPYKEADDAIAKERESLAKTDNYTDKIKSKRSETPIPIRKGIGSFIDLKTLKSNDGDYKSSEKKKKFDTSGAFGNFNNW